VVWSQLPEREAENAAGETGGGVTRKQEDAEVMPSLSFLRNGRTRRARTDQLIEETPDSTEDLRWPAAMEAARRHDQPVDSTNGSEGGSFRRTAT